MNHKYTQIKGKIIRSHGLNDTQKLADLERYIHQTHPRLSVIMQPYLLFTKGEDEYAGMKMTLTESLTKEYTPIPPDMVLHQHNDHRVIIFELDGKIHDIKTVKTEKRNNLYKINGFKTIIINEENLKETLKITKLAQHHINAEFTRRLANII